MHRETDGNPFFVEEVLRHLLETNTLARFERDSASGKAVGPLDLPESVREVIARRLRRLPRAVNEVLTVAAVVGRQFDAAVVGNAAGQSTASVLDALDRAADSGLVREDAAHLGRYTFPHALIRQTLNADLGASRRAQLHADVGAAMEASAGSVHAAAELAFHYTHAVPLVGSGKAISYTTQAGHDAVRDFAFEDAATYFERALELVEQYEPSPASRRVELLTDLASALVYVDEKAGVETALRAVDTARRDGSLVQFGRAVAVAVEPVYGVIAFPAKVTSLFDEARRGARQRRSRAAGPAARIRSVQVRDPYAPRPVGTHTRRGSRRVGTGQRRSHHSCGRALRARGEPRRGCRRHRTDRARRGAREPGPKRGARASAFGLRVLAGAYLELGDADELTSTIEQLGRVGVEFRWLPAHAYTAQFRATQALLEGRFDDVRIYGDDLRGYARAYRGASGMHFMQALYLARERGDLANGNATGRAPEDQAFDLYTWASFALAQLDAGDETAALRTLHRLAAEGFRQREKESGWGAALAMLAEVAATGGALPHAATLYDLLSPYGGRLLTLVLGLACLGAADRYLGMLSTVLERWDEADAHFERALAIEQHARGRALLPRTRYWQARSFRARGGEGDERTADALLASVVEDASRLGMHGLPRASRSVAGAVTPRLEPARPARLDLHDPVFERLPLHVEIHIDTVAGADHPTPRLGPERSVGATFLIRNEEEHHDRVPALADVHFDVGAGRCDPERLDRLLPAEREFDGIPVAEPHDLLERPLALLLDEIGEVGRGTRGQVRRSFELLRSVDERRRTGKPFERVRQHGWVDRNAVEIFGIRRFVHSSLRHLQPRSARRKLRRADPTAMPDAPPGSRVITIGSFARVTSAGFGSSLR